jgi:hypothetical protein
MRLANFLLIYMYSNRDTRAYHILHIIENNAFDFDYLLIGGHENLVQLALAVPLRVLAPEQ